MADSACTFSLEMLEFLTSNRVCGIGRRLQRGVDTVGTLTNGLEVCSRILSLKWVAASKFAAFTGWARLLNFMAITVRRIFSHGGAGLIDRCVSNKSRGLF